MTRRQDELKAFVDGILKIMKQDMMKLVGDMGMPIANVAGKQVMVQWRLYVEDEEIGSGKSKFDSPLVF